MYRFLGYMGWCDAVRCGQLERSTEKIYALRQEAAKDDRIFFMDYYLKMDSRNFIFRFIDSLPKSCLYMAQELVLPPVRSSLEFVSPRLPRCPQDNLTIGHKLDFRVGEKLRRHLLRI